jgi:SAM-dependent methyltransferase
VRRAPTLRAVHAWMSAFGDPLRAVRAMRALPAFFGDYLRYRRQPGAERLSFIDMLPALHERTTTHTFDAHYFYVNAWASRRVAEINPTLHFDIASQAMLSGILSSRQPVVFVDYRPLRASLTGLKVVAGDLLRLPLRGQSVASLSCLHVAEHVGLGRYGDPIDVDGTRKAAVELSRILAPGGNLLFAVPVGRERVAFNAHRVHLAGTIRDHFAALTLREFSGVDDEGHYSENVPLHAFDTNEYACGFFWFVKERLDHPSRLV